MEVIKRGAEAILYRDGNKVVKVRVRKSYRHPLLDERIRRSRTRREARLLARAREVGVNTPRVISVKEEEFTIVMEFVEGKALKQVLRERRDASLMRELGRMVGTLHRNGIVHGDLTTSNVVVAEEGLYLIDFGLGEFSRRIEDKAVDLVCFEKSYVATHSDFPEGWKAFLEGYKEACPEWRAVLVRAEAVKRRARYL